MKRLAGSVQRALDAFASVGERFKNLVNGTSRLISIIVVVVMLLATVVVYFIPIRWLLLVWGVRKFVKKGLAKYQPLGWFKPPRGYRPLNEFFELLGRVPSDVQIVQYRRLPAPDPKKTSLNQRVATVQRFFRGSSGPNNHDASFDASFDSAIMKQ